MVSIDNADMEDAAVDLSGCEPASMQGEGADCGDHETGLEKPAIRDFQAAAETFGTAFNSALYEIETSRRLLAEQAARVSELNEAIQATRSALEDEIEKGRAQTEEHLQEAERLNQRFHEAESERDSLQQRLDEQEKVLGERAAEIVELSGRIAAVNADLEARTAEGLHAQEAFASEKTALAGKISELQGMYDEADVRIQSQLQELEACNGEIVTLHSQVDSLNEDIESRNNEVSRRDGQITELQQAIDEREESMRLQSEAHANACEELNARIDGITGELETLRIAHTDLQKHADRLEDLNQALHESSITEKTVHRQQMEEKSARIESLRSALDAANKSFQETPQSPADTDELKQSLQELEAKLDEALAQNRELELKAEKADKLEELNGRLRIALRKAREYVAEKGEGAQELVLLQEQVVDLQSALEAACSREKELAERLQCQDVSGNSGVTREEAAAETDKVDSAREGAGDTEAALRSELDRLASELSASEEKCRQLEAAMAATGCSEMECLPVDLDATEFRTDSGMPERTRFVSQLDTLLAREGRSEEHHSLMYVLLDNFVLIRDEIGVMESECVVNDIAKIIDTECGPDDVMARFGDCTFAVLCSNSTTGEAEERAVRIRAEVESRIFEYGNRSLVATTSIGVCSVRSNDTSPEDIITRVDLACDAARLTGGNKVIVSSTIADEINITGNAEQHREMVRNTLAEDRIKIYYQPISSLRGQAGNHFEVLVRLVDKSGDMILPGEFFAMAESAGYANEVDRFVIEKVLNNVSGNDDRQVKYYIKLTRQSVADGGLADWIMSRIEQYGVKAEQLVFEIAENILQSDLKNMAALSKALHAIGCKVAIEHYRMVTKLQHLMHVYADFLKIDKALVSGVDKRGECLAKVTAIMDLATRNNYITIAEGVENPACLAIIWELGVSMAQGYFIHAPAERREFVDHDIITGCNEAGCGKATFVIT